MNFSLPKIKFPFKKVKNVCTTEQVIHRVDGQDKKLSEVLKDLNNVGVITIYGDLLNSEFCDTETKSEVTITVKVVDEPTQEHFYVYREEITKLREDPLEYYILRNVGTHTVNNGIVLGILSVYKESEYPYVIMQGSPMDWVRGMYFDTLSFYSKLQTEDSDFAVTWENRQKLYDFTIYGFDSEYPLVNGLTSSTEVPIETKELIVNNWARLNLIIGNLVCWTDGSDVQGCGTITTITGVSAIIYNDTISDDTYVIYNNKSTKYSTIKNTYSGQWTKITIYCGNGLSYDVLVADNHRHTINKINFNLLENGKV